MELGDGGERGGKGFGAQIKQNVDQDVDAKGVARPFSVGRIHGAVADGSERDKRRTLRLTGPFLLVFIFKTRIFH